MTWPTPELTSHVPERRKSLKSTEPSHIALICTWKHGNITWKILEDNIELLHRMLYGSKNYQIIKTLGYLISGERPWGKFHSTSLMVKRKITDINRAGWEIDGRRHPVDQSTVNNDNVGFKYYLIVSISIVQQNNIRLPDFIRR